MKLCKRDIKSFMKIIPFVIDLINISAILYLLLLDSKGKLPECNNYIAIDLILIFLPTLVTVLSIIFSIRKDKEYGVTVGELSRLRGPLLFGFLHMIIVLCSLLVAYTILAFFNMRFIIIALDIVSLFYGLYFAIQEIPFLLMSERRIWKILRHYYKCHSESSIGIINQNSYKIFTSVFQNRILTEGITVVFDKMSRHGREDENYKLNLYDMLLDFQNKYFFDELEDISIVLANPCGEYKNIMVVDAINEGYRNIEDLLKDDIFSFLDGQKSTYHITRTTFSLHKICRDLKLMEKEHKELNRILSTYINLFPSHNNKRFDSYIVLMSVSTLKEGDTWFLKEIRDSDHFGYALYIFAGLHIGIFISSFINHIIKNRWVDDSKADSIRDFMREKSKSFNLSGESWNDMIKRNIEYGNPYEILKSINELKYFYDSISSSYYLNFSKNSFSDLSDEFTIDFLIDSWIELVLFGGIHQIRKEDLKKTIESLDDDLKENLVATLSTKWIRDGKLNTDLKIDFLDMFYKNIVPKENWHNNELIEEFSCFQNNYKINKVMGILNNRQVNFDNMYKQLEESFDKTVSSIDTCILDDESDLNNEKSLYQHLLIQFDESEALFNSYCESLSDSLLSFLNKEIKTQLKINYYCDYNDLSNELLKIEKFEPTMYSHLSFLSYNDKIKEISANFYSISSSAVPNDTFLKEGGIKIGLQYDKEHTKIRYMDNDEIEKYIEKNYTMINGLYKYYLFNNDESSSILLSYEGLKKILKKYIVLSFAFKKKIVVDQDKCLYFKYRNK